MTNNVVTQTQRWIPVSENLPSGEALCCNDKGDMMIGYLSRNDYYGCVVAEWGSQIMWDVKAWMPLPEAYKKGSEET